MINEYGLVKEMYSLHTILVELTLPLLGAKQLGLLLGPSTSKSKGLTGPPMVRHASNPMNKVFFFKY